MHSNNPTKKRENGEKGINNDPLKEEEAEQLEDKKHNNDRRLYGMTLTDVYTEFDKFCDEGNEPSDIEEFGAFLAEKSKKISEKMKNIIANRVPDYNLKDFTKEKEQEWEEEEEKEVEADWEEKYKAYNERIYLESIKGELEVDAKYQRRKKKVYLDEDYEEEFYCSDKDLAEIESEIQNLSYLDFLQEENSFDYYDYLDFLEREDIDAYNEYIDDKIQDYAESLGKKKDSDYNEQSDK